MRRTSAPTGSVGEAREADEAREAHVEPRWWVRLHRRLHRNAVTGLITKAVVTVIGALVLLAGVVMMVTPGPGIVGIALGLAILSTEWRWADRWLGAARAAAVRAAEKAREMDPRVRRRRILVALAAVVVALVATWALIAAVGWPQMAVDGWGWVRGRAGWLPWLPGMNA